ncbi:MAG TPA: hypothetical protein VM656_00175, partial [Pyrinomonadaceae bacterium]|nr:hypothetical protein [Pyrinomonadaceae bacterium]
MTASRVYIIALVMLGLLSVQVSSAKSTNATVIAKSSAAAALKPEGVRVSIELVADERRNNQSLASRVAKV